MITGRKKGKLLFLFLLLMLVLTACGKKKNEPFTYRGPSEKKAETEVSEEQQPTEYIIKEVNMADETITAIGEKGGMIRCSYNLGTRFLDKYGDTCSSTNFTPGQVVRLGERNAKSVVSSVQLSDTVWNYEDVTNYSIDGDRGVFTIGDSNYRLTDKTVVFSGDEVSSMDDIGQDDTLQVVGRDKDVISVIVTTGHGYIQLVNTKLFRDSMVCIGNRIFAMITGDMKIEVPEGTYDLTVANNGYGGTQEVVVARNETVIVDLDQLKGSGPKMCKLTLESEIAGVAAYIDGKQITVGETLEVTYGTHRLSVIAEGYESWEKTLVVNSKSATIALDLSEETEETTGQQNNNGTSDNSSGNAQSNTQSTTGTSSGTNKNSSSQSSNGNNSSGTSGSKTELSDTEVDYLTTISNMLTQMLKD